MYMTWIEEQIEQCVQQWVSMHLSTDFHGFDVKKGKKMFTHDLLTLLKFF